MIFFLLVKRNDRKVFGFGLIAVMMLAAFISKM